jgi:hypothetical protein
MPKPTHRPAPHLRTNLLVLLLAGLGLVAGTAAAQPEPAACDDVVDVSREQHYRQLSLDLNGRVPSVAELDALAANPDLDPVDALVDSPEFSAFVRRHHRDLLWPSTEFLDVVNAAFNLLLPAASYESGGDGGRLFVLFVGFYQRNGLVPCKDEPAEFDADGNLIFEDWPDGTRRDGWVMAEPYWAPGTQVKICAAEAALNLQATTGAGCDTYQGMATGTCGCGPNLTRCADIGTVQTIGASLQEQLLRMVEAPILEGRPYTDMLTTQQELVNGPLVHYYRYLVPLVIEPIVQVAPVALDALPDVPYTDSAWRAVPRAYQAHSGILTSISFLLRFQTARARANRFYHAYLCEPFIAPPNDLPSPNDPCSQEPNLSERCGCNACHARLEPAAAWWGRFAEAGTMYLEPERFPTFLSRCATCARDPNVVCDPICERFYVSEIGHPDQAEFAGVLKSYEWRGADDIARVEAGPKGLVQAALDDGRLPICVATKLFERLYHRSPTVTEQVEVLPGFRDAFVQSNYDFKTLVRAMVRDPGYGRLAR